MPSTIKDYLVESLKGFYDRGPVKFGEGECSVAEGSYTTASGDCSHAEGSGTTAYATAHAEGADTTAFGYCSHSEGRQTFAQGNYAHSEGFQTFAGDSGAAPRPEVTANTRKGFFAHSEGHHTLAEGNSSHAEGKDTQALNQSEHAEGQFNVSHKASTTYGNSGNTQHSVGIGTSSADTKNAFEIMQNGDAYLYGVGGYTGTSISGATTLQNSLLKKPVVVYETDGTTGLLGINESSFGTDNWQLTGLTLSDFSYLKCYIKASVTGASQFTPSMVIELPLDTAARGSEHYIASSSSIIPFNRNRHFCVGVAVDSTKTKFKVVYETTLWDVSVSDANSAADGRYLYKIVGYYD